MLRGNFLALGVSMKISTLLCLALLVLSAACGKKGDTEQAVRRTPIDPKEIERIMRHQVIECEAVGGGKCPDGVARLLIINPEHKEASKVCTGFMVSKTKMITNHHCVPDQATCNNTNIAVYIDGDYQRTKCKKLIMAREDHLDARNSKRKVDFAVFELVDEFKGKVFKVSRSRATPKDQVTTWVIDHTGLDGQRKNTTHSRITEFRCEVELQKSTESLMLQNCPIIQGNSGSPALNASGEVVGVIWGGSLDPKYTTQTPIEERRASKGNGLVTEMIHFDKFI